MNKNVNIKDFIGVYDGFIPEAECKKVITFYEEQNKLKRTLNRISSEGAPALKKQDQQLFCNHNDVDVWWDQLKVMMFNFEAAWKHYDEQTGAVSAFDQDDLHFTALKIQKTLPTEGYHVWHLEHGKAFEALQRAFVFSIYLNDVEEGGETEFLHFSKRVKPKTGRIVIWPSSFPYLHRGNPPLSGEKYILTSWMMLT
jgi:hypothetical protein